MTFHTTLPASSSLGLDTEGNRSSGPSPTVHLLGVGKVGQAFLATLADADLRLVGVTDSTASLHDKRGLDARAILSHKQARRGIRALDGAEAVPVELALGLVAADVVVDATPTDLDAPERAVRRCRAALRAGSSLALAAKDALARAGDELLAGGHVGCNATLGGTGARLVAELATLRERCNEIAIAANASTTALVLLLEAGLALDEAIVRVRAKGLLESDPTLDLDGSDAATKLAIVARAVFGTQVQPRAIARDDIRALDPELVRWRRRKGRTTRLVGRADRSGRAQVAYEEILPSSPLATPDDRVAYTYRLSDGQRRVHTGCGIGPVETSRALLLDVVRLAGQGAAR